MARFTPGVIILMVKSVLIAQKELWCSGPQKVEGLPIIIAITQVFAIVWRSILYGNVWVWGNNIAGQLGTGDRADLRKPTQISLPSKVLYNRWLSVLAGHAL